MCVHRLIEEHLTVWHWHIETNYLGKHRESRSLVLVLPVRTAKHKHQHITLLRSMPAACPTCVRCNSLFSFFAVFLLNARTFNKTKFLPPRTFFYLILSFDATLQVLSFFGYFRRSLRNSHSTKCKVFIGTIIEIQFFNIKFICI